MHLMRACVGWMLVLCWPALAQEYDLVLRGGRVIDPANNIDRVMDIGITGNRITAETGYIADARARKIVNVSGMIVVPGLIDTQTMRDGMAFSGDPNMAQEAAAKIPLGRFGTAEELANAVVFLASDEASFITGVALLVDGGKYPTL